MLKKVLVITKGKTADGTSWASQITTCNRIVKKSEFLYGILICFYQVV